MSTADKSSQIPTNVSPLRFMVAESAWTLHCRHAMAKKEIAIRGEACKLLEPPHLLDWSRLAILVHQGSDPTLPYQALVIRESARLF